MWKTLTAALSVAFLCAGPARAEPPVVVASLQPLHSLAAAVMQGVGTPRLIVGGVASEHTYTLKPSDARRIEGAGLVVLVDLDYETFLRKPLRTLAPKAQVLEAADLPGVTRLPRRDGGVWEADGHEHGHGHGPSLDGHVWLDPTNAKAIVAALGQRLAAMDPANAATYAANAAGTAQRIDALDARLKARLAPVAAAPYVVFHDAYQYFERHYGLSAAGAIAVDPDRPPSPKRLAQLRDRLKGARAACVFREPQFPAAAVDQLAGAAGAGLGVLDPQGADIPVGPDHWLTLMANLAEGFAQCLSGR